MSRDRLQVVPIRASADRNITQNARLWLADQRFGAQHIDVYTVSGL
jgi:hypothetical protein